MLDEMLMVARGYTHPEMGIEYRLESDTYLHRFSDQDKPRALGLQEVEDKLNMFREYQRLMNDENYEDAKIVATQLSEKLYDKANDLFEAQGWITAPTPPRGYDIGRMTKPEDFGFGF